MSSSPAFVRFTAASASVVTYALQCGLLAADLDLLRLGFRPLGQGDLQDPLVIAGFHPLRVNRVGQLEGPGERTIPALNAMEVLFLLFLFELAFALDGQRAV